MTRSGISVTTPALTYLYTTLTLTLMSTRYVSSTGADTFSSLIKPCSLYIHSFIEWHQFWMSVCSISSTLPPLFCVDIYPTEDSPRQISVTRHCAASYRRSHALSCPTGPLPTLEVRYLTHFD